MHEYPRYYRNSGAFNPMLTVTWTIPLMIVAAIAGCAYGWLIWVNPFIYINLLALLALGVAVGFLVMLAVNMAAIRNSLVVAVVAVLLGGSALVGAWEMWLNRYFERGLTEALTAFGSEQGWDEATQAGMRDGMAMVANGALAPYGGEIGFPPFPNPARIVRFLHAEVAPEGVWELSGSQVKGIALEVIWGIEALVILLAPLLIGISSAASSVYDEVTGEWLSKDEKREPLEPIVDLERLKGAMERGDFAPLGALRRIAADATSYTRVELLLNPGETAFAVRLKEVTVTRNKDGESKSDKTIVPAMLISAEQFAVARQAGTTRFAGEDSDAPPTT